MGEASIPVDLRNPGQVFASLGFLEAADVLLRDAEGGFDWSDEANVRFRLRAGDGEGNPFHAVLGFLSTASIEDVSPSDTWPAPDPEKGKGAHPVCLTRDQTRLLLSHWADGSSRDAFKQFTARQSPKKTIVPALVKEIRELLQGDRLVQNPYGPVRPVGRQSWKLDARAAWNPRDVGYSLNDQNQALATSPVVELLGALGLEHARPSVDTRDYLNVRYGAWAAALPPSLARPALGAAQIGVPLRTFSVRRSTAGQDDAYTQITFATQEASP